MKKINVLFIVLLASSFFAIGSIAQEDTIRAKAAEKLSPEMVQKLTNQELVEIITQREKLEAETKMEELRNAREREEYQPNGFSITLWILLVFAFLFSTFAIPLFYNYRRGKAKQQLVEKLLDSGKEIPLELIENLIYGNSFSKALNDKMAAGLAKEKEYTGIKTGITLVSLGLGVGIFLFFLNNHNNFWTIGFVPLFIGIGYLIIHKLVSSKKQDENSEI